MSEMSMNRFIMIRMHTFFFNISRLSLCIKTFFSRPMKSHLMSPEEAGFISVGTMQPEKEMPDNEKKDEIIRSLYLTFK